MTVSPYVRANTGSDAPRWRTFDGSVVLAVARTFTSTVRLLEGLSVFRGDTRVLVVFTFDGTSAFNAGTERLLDDLGACVVPWEQRREVSPQLVITASENTDLAEFTCPVVILPHGVGFQKYVPDHRVDETRLSGVPRTEFQESRHVHLVLSHSSQREQLRRADVPLAEWAEVVGDPTRDRLAGSGRVREEYREHLGVRPDQRLVVVTSTWGPGGLIGSRPGLPGALLGALPHDDYRVAAILHPNVWFAHSPWQVRHMLADALDAGLLLIPPHAGWGAALVASDCVIGDHGSVTLYGASMDRPVLMAAAGEETVPDTAAAELVHSADRLRTEGLRPQVERAIDTHRPGRYDRATGRAFAHPGHGERLLSALLYRRLGLKPARGNGTGLLLPVPEPDSAGRAPGSFEVHGYAPTADEVVIERFPAATRETPPAPSEAVRHLSAHENERRNALVTSASVVCRASTRGPRTTAESEGWPERALATYPGAFVTACPVAEGTLVSLRDGRSYLVRGSAAEEPSLAAAVVYTLVRAHGEPPAVCKARVGPLRWECRISPVSSCRG